MENLTNKTTEDNDSGLIKALAIAFPDAIISDVISKSSLKFHANSINNEQFANLHTISTLYKKEINLKRSAAKICVELTDQREELEDEN